MRSFNIAELELIKRIAVEKRHKLWLDNWAKRFKGNPSLEQIQKLQESVFSNKCREEGRLTDIINLIDEIDSKFQKHLKGEEVEM